LLTAFQFARRLRKRGQKLTTRAKTPNKIRLRNEKENDDSDRTSTHNGMDVCYQQP